MRHLRLSAVVSIFATVLPVGCSQPNGAITPALMDVTGDARTVQFKAGPFDGFTIGEHRQAVSIGGLLNIPDIGQEYQWSAKNDVTTAVGIAVVQSYRLIGETDIPDASQVTRVRDALERTRDLALEATLLTADIARLRAELESGTTGAAEATQAMLRQSLWQDLERRGNERAAVERELKDAQNDLRTSANSPGIIIARWSTADTAGASVQFGAGAAAAGTASGQRSGFVILGGLRTVSVAFGEDFWWLLNNLRPGEKKHLDLYGITTGLIQARHVAYVSDSAVQQAIAIQADPRKIDFNAPESVQIAAYWSFLGQYSNSGNLPRITWRREPFCAVCSLDLPGLATPEERALQAYFGVQHCALDPATFQGWRTVSANITYFRDVVGGLGFSWQDEAKKYACDRKMWPASSCPYCGPTPPEARAAPEHPAVVPGSNDAASSLGVQCKVKP